MKARYPRVFRPEGACLVPWTLSWTQWAPLANDNGAGSEGWLLDWQGSRFVRAASPVQDKQFGGGKTMTDYNEGEELPWLAEAGDDEPEQCEECGWEQRHCSCLAFADPTGRSALRAGTREHPCPSCGDPNKLTTADVALGYQCDSCADSAEGFGP